MNGHYFDISMYDYSDYTDKWNAVCESNNNHKLIADSGEKIITAACTLTFDDESFAGEITFKLSDTLAVLDTQLLDDSNNEILDLHADTDSRKIILAALLNYAKCDNDLKNFIFDLIHTQ